MSSNLNYAGIYDAKFMKHADGIMNLRNGHIKFGDALAAVCYAHGITYQQLIDRFPEVKLNERYHGKQYTVQDQLDFVRANATRTPKNVLEIGSGRGEVTGFLRELGIQVTSVEPGEAAKELHDESHRHLYGKTFDFNLINGSLHTANIDYSQFDTILMVESLEHILAEHFDPEWDKINNTFKGYFIAVNWKRYHPIAVGQYAAPSIHCRLVNDELYDKFSEGHITHYRDRSHLCIEL